MCIYIYIYITIKTIEQTLGKLHVPLYPSKKKFGVALGDCISAFCVLLNRTGTNLHLILECHRNVTELTEVHDLHILSISKF